MDVVNVLKRLGFIYFDCNTCLKAFSSFWQFIYCTEPINSVFSNLLRGKIFLRTKAQHMPQTKSFFFRREIYKIFSRTSTENRIHFSCKDYVSFEVCTALKRWFLSDLHWWSSSWNCSKNSENCCTRNWFFHTFFKNEDNFLLCQNVSQL